MSLKGSLQTVALPEVLQLLSSTGKRGGLHVVGDAGEGRLWFGDGRITAHSAGSAKAPAEAIFELLRVDDGDFSFVVDEETPFDAVRVEGGADVGPSLAAAQARLVEWHEITQVVPSLDHHLQLAGEAPDDEILMDRSQWALVVAVGDGRSVRKVLDRVGHPEFEGCQAVRGLIDAGLVGVHEPVAVSVTPMTTLSLVVDEEPAEVADEPVVDEPVVEAAEAVGESVEDVEFVEDVESLPASMLRFGVDEDVSFGSVVEELPPFDEAAAAFDEPAPAFDDYFASVPTESELPGEGPETDDGSFEQVEAAYDHEVATESASEADDRYAALRAAMLEANDSDGAFGSEGDDSYADESDDSDATSQHYEIGAEPDSRAALEALLSEVRGEEEAAHNASVSTWAESEAPAYEPIDGLADRGPWTEHELASMEPETWAASSAGEGAGDLVAFGVPAAEVAAEHTAVEYGDEPAQAEEAGDPQAAPSEEPINRGLLLKFLSSVRN